MIASIILGFIGVGVGGIILVFTLSEYSAYDLSGPLHDRRVWIGFALMFLGALLMIKDSWAY